MSIATRLIVPGMVAAAGFVGVSGASLLSNVTASAATTSGTATSTTSGTTSTTSSTTSAAADTQTSMPAHGSASHEDAETAVTGDNATKAQAAAVKYVGSGTAGAVTTDYTKTGYETTVTKSDGSTVEVHLDSSFAVMQGGPGAPDSGTTNN